MSDERRVYDIPLSTLQAVFEGRRELFEAFTTDYGIEQPQLFITEWKAVQL